MAFTIPRPVATVKPFEIPDATEQLKNIVAAQLAQERIKALRARTALAQQKASGQSEGQIYDPTTGQYRSTTIQGKYKKEREASLGAQQDELLRQLIANNEALKKLQSSDFENMDVQRKDKAIQEAALQAEKLMRPDAPDAVKTRFSDMVNAYLDPYRSRVSQEYKTVEEHDDWEYFRDNLKLGVMRGKDALASFFLNESPEELKQRNDAYNAYEQELREKNAYMMDQYRRAQHGEDFWDQMTGDSGNIANNLLGAALSSPLEIGIPAVVTALTAPVSIPIAGAASLATGVLASAPAGGWEYQRSVLNDGTLTAEEQAHAIEEGTNEARAISGVAGALPGFIGKGVSILRGAATRPATKAVLDAQFKAAATKAAAESGEAAPQFADDFLSTARRVAAQQDANAGRLSRAAQGVAAAGAEGFLSGGGEQIAQNVATRVGTGRDVGVMDNVLENALIEAVVGAPLGTAAALRRTNKTAKPSTTTPAPTDSSSGTDADAGASAAESAGPSVKFNREFRAKVNQDLADGKPFDAAAIKREYLSNGYTEKDWATFVGNNDKIVADKRFSPEVQQQLLHTVEAQATPAADTPAVAAEENPFRLLPSNTDLNTVLTEDKVGRAQSLISFLRKTKSGDTDKVVKEMRRLMAEENLTLEDISAIATIARLGKNVESTGAVAKVRAKNPAPVSKAASANVINAFEVLNTEEIAKRKELAANVNAARAMANELGEANGQQGPASVESNVAGAATGSGQRAAGSSGGVAATSAAANAGSANVNVAGVAAGNTQTQGGGAGRSAEQNNSAAVPTAGTPQGAQPAAAEGGAERGPSAGNATQADAGPSAGAGTPTAERVGPTAGTGNEADAGGTGDASHGAEQRTVDQLYYDMRNPAVRTEAGRLKRAGRTPEQAERDAEILYRLANTLSEAFGETPQQILSNVHFELGVDTNHVVNSLLQTGWTGSGARFDHFTTDKIGSGQGARVHGYGLYIALTNRKPGERPAQKVAKRYQIMYQKLNFEAVFKGKKLTPAEQKEFFGPIYSQLQSYTGDLDAYTHLIRLAIGYESREVERYEKRISKAKGTEQDITEYREKLAEAKEKLDTLSRVLKAIESGELHISRETSGRTYYVNVPDDDVLLHERNVLAEQPAAVRKAISEISKTLESMAQDYRSDKNAYIGLQRTIEILNDAESTGYDVYWALVHLYDILPNREIDTNLRLNSERAASILFQQYGIEGIRYKGRIDGDCAVVFNGAAIEILATFDQTNERGRIDFLNDGTMNILFGEKADASTAIHEFEHMFVNETLRRLSKDNTPASPAKDQLIADMTTLAKFVGVDPARATDFDAWTTKAHEKAAKAFEKYFREGKAPVPELQGLFSKMKELLTQIYRRAKNLLGDKLTPEVRAVFDRQLTGYRTRTDMSRTAEAEPTVLGETPIPDDVYWNRTAQDDTLDIDEMDRLDRAYPFLKNEVIC